MERMPEMIRQLAASAAHPAHAENLMLFGRFVGSWDLDITGYRGDGSAVRARGEWHFGWVLEGRGIQDVLITETVEGGKRTIGSTLRVYDPRGHRWWIVWMDPTDDEFVVLFADVQGDDIVMEGQWGHIPGRRRWRFHDISDDGFRWTAEASNNGDIWNVVQEMTARRRPGRR